jgi:hypothetical protein
VLPAVLIHGLLISLYPFKKNTGTSELSLFRVEDHDRRKVKLFQLISCVQQGNCNKGFQ